MTSFIKWSDFRWEAISYHLCLDTSRSFLGFGCVGEGQVRGEYYPVITHQTDRDLRRLTHKLPRALKRWNIWYKTQQTLSTSVKTEKERMLITRKPKLNKLYLYESVLSQRCSKYTSVKDIKAWTHALTTASRTPQLQRWKTNALTIVSLTPQPQRWKTHVLTTVSRTPQSQRWKAHAPTTVTRVQSQCHRQYPIPNCTCSLC